MLKRRSVKVVGAVVIHGWNLEECCQDCGESEQVGHKYHVQLKVLLMLLLPVLNDANNCEQINTYGAALDHEGLKVAALHAIVISMSCK